jgi:hypothetical protein
VLNSYTTVFANGPGGDICTISTRYEHDNELFYCNRIFGPKLRICYALITLVYSVKKKALRYTEPLSKELHCLATEGL